MENANSRMVAHLPMESMNLIKNNIYLQIIKQNYANNFTIISHFTALMETDASSYTHNMTFLINKLSIPIQPF